MQEEWASRAQSFALETKQLWFSAPAQPAVASRALSQNIIRYSILDVELKIVATPV